jgi:hypothetical protein
LCKGCAMNFAMRQQGGIGKEFVFLEKGTVRPGGRYSGGAFGQFFRRWKRWVLNSVTLSGEFRCPVES